MTKPFRRLIEKLPPERRRRIDAHAKALLQEYELLQALRQNRKV